uniref:Uncharacterized protein n=1 Tax=Lactuca sativa TaxID=4236 RepID=A0A9R1W1V2_LACSA|nr:hypothetical protein LSAT_V11C300155050 [Lactuca sativa]
MKLMMEDAIDDWLLRKIHWLRREDIVAHGIRLIQDVISPNAVVIARNWKIGALLLQRLLYNFPPQSNTDLDSYIIGDKSILQDVGIKNLKNVEALTALLDVNLCRSMMVYK